MARSGIILAVWALLFVPLAVGAQTTAKIHRVGVLDGVPLAANEANLGAFREGLRALGHVEGQNLVIEYRSADGRAERFPDLAAELVRLEVDVIVTRGTPAALGARHVTGTIPIVMATSGDPVYAGLVTSLARPGGNVTGHHMIVPPGLAARRLQILREIMPTLSRVGVVLDSGDVYAQLVMREMERVARPMGIQLRSVPTQRPADLDRAFESAILDRVEALVAVEGVLTASDLTRIVSFAAMSRLPAIYGTREFVDGGGLIAYGTDVRDLFRRSAGYVHKILGGARPAELPVEAPSRFELVINLKTARAIGLTIPPSLLTRADHVIQ